MRSVFWLSYCIGPCPDDLRSDLRSNFKSKAAPAIFTGLWLSPRGDKNQVSHVADHFCGMSALLLCCIIIYIFFFGWPGRSEAREGGLWGRLAWFGSDLCRKVPCHALWPRASSMQDRQGQGRGGCPAWWESSREHP